MVVIERVQEKIKSAVEGKRILYIQGGVGRGKTTAVRTFFRNRPCCYVSGENGYLDTDEIIRMPENTPLVIDDISQIRDTVSQEFAAGLVLNRRKRALIFIGRGLLPPWLYLHLAPEELDTVTPEELSLEQEHVKKLAEDMGTCISRDEISTLLDASNGHAYQINCAVSIMAADHCDLTHALDESRRRWYYQLDYRMTDFLNKDLQRMLLTLWRLPDFSVYIAELVTGNRKSALILEQGLYVCDCLESVNFSFSIRKEYLPYLAWKEQVTLSREQVKQNLEKIARYFELNDRTEDALECYRQAESWDKMAALISRIVSEEQGMEATAPLLNRYLLLLPEDYIWDDPVLMSAMAMGSSIMLDPDRSERWYRALSDYEKRSAIGSADKIEAQRLIDLLNIILPHRESSDLLIHLSSALGSSRGWGELYHRISITDNTPSVPCPHVPILETAKEAEQTPFGEQRS